MKEIITTVTQRGQVTIPAEVRRTLGLKPKDKVTFAIEGQEVRLMRVAFTLDKAYGSVRPNRKPEDFQKIAVTAKDAKAVDTAEEIGQP